MFVLRESLLSDRIDDACSTTEALQSGTLHNLKSPIFFVDKNVLVFSRRVRISTNFSKDGSKKAFKAQHRHVKRLLNRQTTEALRRSDLTKRTRRINVARVRRLYPAFRKLVQSVQMSALMKAHMKLIFGREALGERRTGAEF